MLLNKSNLSFDATWRLGLVHTKYDISKYVSFRNSAVILVPKISGLRRSIGWEIVVSEQVNIDYENLLVMHSMVTHPVDYRILKCESVHDH